MITVPVHKDVLSYEPKVIAVLTQRTLVFTGVAVGAGILTGALTMGVLGLPPEAAMYPIMLVALPIWAVGYLRPCGVKPEQLAPYWLRSTFLPQQLTHVSNAHLKGRVPAAGLGRDAMTEGYANVSARTVQRHYAKLRGIRGIEGYDPTESLGVSLDPRDSRPARG